MPGPADPLFRSGPTGAEVEPADAVAVVSAFLHRCRGWGTDREIPKLTARLAQAATPEDAARLHAWTSFVAFLDHARTELEQGRLDDWFGPGPGL